MTSPPIPTGRQSTAGPARPDQTGDSHAHIPLHHRRTCPLAAPGHAGAGGPGAPRAPAPRARQDVPAEATERRLQRVLRMPCGCAHNPPHDITACQSRPSIRSGPLRHPAWPKKVPGGHQHWTKRDLTPACWRTISKTTGERFTSWHGHGWIFSTPPSVPASRPPAGQAASPAVRSATPPGSSRERAVPIGINTARCGGSHVAAEVRSRLVGMRRPGYVYKRVSEREFNPHARDLRRY